MLWPALHQGLFCKRSLFRLMLNNLSTSPSDVNSKIITTQSNAIKRNYFSTIKKNYFECSEFFTEKKLSARFAIFDQETEANKNALLGTNRDFTAPPPRSIGNDSTYFRLNKWARHAVYRKIIGTKAADFCHRGLVPLILPDGKRLQRNLVDVWKKEQNFSYGGLFTCGSVWICPVCAAKISNHRRMEMNKALTVAESKGLQVLHLTLTAPHHLGESLEDLIEKMSKALRLMFHRKPWKRLKLALGLKGTIRALENPHSWSNGWHVHFHELLICEKLFCDIHLREIKKDIFNQWLSACLTAGLQAPSEFNGVDLADGRSAGDYIGKWGVEDEMTKAHIKKGRGDSLSAFQFLDKILEGDLRYEPLFKEHAKAMKGRNQLVWSRGLREYLKMEEELTDEKIAESQESESELFAQIPLEVWAVILQKEKRGEVLEACRGGEENLKIYLNNLIKSKGLNSEQNQRH